MPLEGADVDGTDHVEHSASREDYVAYQRARILAMLAETDVHPGEYDRIVVGLRHGTATRVLERYPEAVVIGDLHNEFSWHRVNRLYGMLRGGARLVALHKNRYCTRQNALALALGPFVAALEYAAAVEADIMGKPSPAFYAMALASLGLDAGDVVMVGDDIEADIGGAQNAGLRAVQVETGKYNTGDRRHPRIAPDGRIPSIAELPAFMAGMA